MSQTNGADEDILRSTLRASVASGAVLPTRGWSSVVRVLIPREGLLPAAVRAVVSSVRLSPQTVRERDAVVVELIGFHAQVFERRALLQDTRALKQTVAAEHVAALQTHRFVQGVHADGARQHVHVAVCLIEVGVRVLVVLVLVVVKVPVRSLQSSLHHSRHRPEFQDEWREEHLELAVGPVPP